MSKSADDGRKTSKLRGLMSCDDELVVLLVINGDGVLRWRGRRRSVQYLEIENDGWKIRAFRFDIIKEGNQCPIHHEDAVLSSGGVRRVP